MQGCDIYVVDDGLRALGSGRCRGQNDPETEPETYCAPVSPHGATQLGKNEIYCLITQPRTPFAVASFYTDFHDMSDDEVREEYWRGKSNIENVTIKS